MLSLRVRRWRSSGNVYSLNVLLAGRLGRTHGFSKGLDGVIPVCGEDGSEPEQVPGEAER